ncbi:MAG: Ig-like domain-containing protein [Blastocatellia bacterium]
MFVLISAIVFISKSRADQSNLVVVSAASYSEKAIAPEAIVSAFGANLSATTATATDTDPNLDGIQLPATLGGTSVRVKGIAAPLLFVSPQQVNFIIPASIAPSKDEQDYVEVEVTTGNGAVSRGRILVAVVAPAIFTFDGSGRGMPAAYLVRAKGSTVQYESLVERDSVTGGLTFRPIDLGAEGERVFLILYLSGIRKAADPDGDGNANETIRVNLNGFEIAPSYAGRQPTFPGLDQINVEISRRFAGHRQLAIRVLAGAPVANLNAANSPSANSAVSNTTEVPLVVPPVVEPQWEPAGLANQDVHAFVAADSLLIAGASAGIFRSVNEGANWLPVVYGLPIAEQKRRTFSLLKTGDSFFTAGTDGAGIWTSYREAEAWTTTEFSVPVNNERVLSLTATARMQFAGTAGNGVFRQYNSLENGSPFWRDAGLKGQTITAMAALGNRVFAGTQGGGLMLTTNEGDSWTTVAGGLPDTARVNTLEILDRTIYAGTATGLWRSRDAGANWTELKLPANTAVNAVLADGTNIFLGTGGGGVLVSTDNGATWNPYNTSLANQTVFALINFGGRLYAGTKGGGIFATQLFPDSNLPPTADAQTVALDEDTSLSIKLTGGDPDGDPLSFKIVTSPKRGYLSGSAPNLTYTPLPNLFGEDSFGFVTNDGKASSRLATVTINVRPVEDPLQISIEGDESEIIGGLIVLYVHGFDPDGDKVRLAAKSMPPGAILESEADPSHAVAKWVPAAAGAFTFSFIATAENGENLSKEFKVNIAPPRMTNDWSQTPLFVDKRVETILADGTTIYLTLAGVGADRKAALLRSTDSGRTWLRIGNGLPNQLYEPGVVNGGTALYLASTEGLFCSTNGGMDWANITAGKGLPEDGKNLNTAAQSDKLLAWSSQRLQFSRNAGGSWTELTEKLPIKPNGSAVLPGGSIRSAALIGDALVVSLSSGNVSGGPITFRSTNDGANWQAASAGIAGSSSINEFILDGESLYSLSAFHFHLSSDRGATWRALNPLFSSNRPGITPNMHAAVNGDLMLVAYRNGGIYVSRNKGDAWDEFSAGLNEQARYVAVGHSSLFAVTSSGRLFIRPRN